MKFLVVSNIVSMGEIHVAYAAHFLDLFDQRVA